MKEELKPCPFCGCRMTIRQGKYPNGDPLIEPLGLHDNTCPLHEVIWTTYIEDGWTRDNLIDRWNRRTIK